MVGVAAGCGRIAGGFVVAGVLAAAIAAGAAEDDGQDVARRVRDPSGEVRLHAAIDAVNNPRLGVPALPALLAQLGVEREDRVRTLLVQALGAAGAGRPEVAEALVAALRDDRASTVRQAAAESLERLAAPGAVPALIAALQDPEDPVRWAAGRALGSIGAQSGIVVPALVAALEDPKSVDPALAALRTLAVRSLPAVPALRRLLAARDTGDARRRELLWTLNAIGPGAAEAAAECRPLLRDPYVYVRLAAAVALITFGRETGAAAQTLTELLRFDNGSGNANDAFERRDVIAIAADTLAAHAVLASGESVAALAQAAEDRNSEVRNHAAAAFDAVLKAMVQQRRFDALDSLAAARDFLAGSSVEGLRNRSRSVAAAVAELEAAQPLPVRLQRHAGLVAAAAAALLALAALALRRRWRRAPRVFLSYRRGDSTAWCGRLYDRLESLLGEGRAFRDIESLEPGTRFQQRLRERIAASDAFVAVIGPGWLAAADGAGERRIDQAQDYVRMEVELALALGKPLFPVLVDGARMPTAAELPPSIAALATANAIPLTDAHFAADVAKLVKSIRASARR